MIYSQAVLLACVGGAALVSAQTDFPPGRTRHRVIDVDAKHRHDTAAANHQKHQQYLDRLAHGHHYRHRNDRRDHDFKVEGVAAVVGTASAISDKAKQKAQDAKWAAKDTVIAALARRHPNEEAALVARDIFEDLYARYFDEIDELD